MLKWGGCQSYWILKHNFKNLLSSKVGCLASAIITSTLICLWVSRGGEGTNCSQTPAAVKGWACGRGLGWFENGLEGGRVVRFVTGQPLPSGAQMLFSFTAGEVTHARACERVGEKQQQREKKDYHIRRTSLSKLFIFIHWDIFKSYSPYVFRYWRRKRKAEIGLNNRGNMEDCSWPRGRFLIPNRDWHGEESFGKEEV